MRPVASQAQDALERPQIKEWCTRFFAQRVYEHGKRVLEPREKALCKGKVMVIMPTATGNACSISRARSRPPRGPVTDGRQPTQGAPGPHIRTCCACPEAEPLGSSKPWEVVLVQDFWFRRTFLDLLDLLCCRTRGFCRQRAYCPHNATTARAAPFPWPSPHSQPSKGPFRGPLRLGPWLANHMYGKQSRGADPF